ncbi:hypothetical protein N9T63_02135, partial [Candidatus Marinimicrobia bacterium]|nr:hypothetical protein [Candidatus Neomarinimicrobiota bacterium]
IGLILFSSMVAFITSVFEAKLDELKRGRSIVLENEHTLILGFGDRILEIIRELIEANESEADASIVILAENDKEEMDNIVRDNIENTLSTRIITRSGVVTNINNLKKVMAEKSKLNIFLGSYPITPASDILHTLSSWKHFGVQTFQAEDEIAGVTSAIGAAYTGSLSVTTTSGPGIALKGEALGLAIITELPLVVINVQRGGPSTGLPTKTEQSDLNQALYGRNGEAPMPVIAAATPGDCFYAAYEACRIAVKYMTPVMLLTDGYLANGSEPWMIPNMDELEPIDVKFAKKPNADGDYLPYLRDKKTLSRPWAIPGTKGLEHRVGGIEKAENTGHVSYDPENHHRMTLLRQEKVDKVQNEIAPTEVYGEKSGDLLILSWGGTFGASRSAAETLQEEGFKVSHIHVRWISPLPKDLGKLVKSYANVLVPEINLGQFLRLIRAEYLVDAKGLNLVRGRPIGAATIVEKVKETLG